MINVLIICNNFEMIKKIINNILSKIENIKIIGIMDSLDFSLEILETEANLIITNDKDLISEILNNKYLTSLKILSISYTDQKYYDYKNVFEINYLSSDDEVISSLQSFITTSFNDPSKEKITKMLRNIGFDFNLSGTIFLIDSIVYIHSFKGFSFDNLHRDVYPYVANLNNTTIERVKWSIERCIKYLYYKSDKRTDDAIYNYFGIRYPDKLTPKLLINLISNSL